MIEIVEISEYNRTLIKGVHTGEFEKNGGEIEVEGGNDGRIKINDNGEINIAIIKNNEIKYISVKRKLKSIHLKLKGKFKLLLMRLIAGIDTEEINVDGEDTTIINNELKIIYKRAGEFYVYYKDKRVYINSPDLTIYEETKGRGIISDSRYHLIRREKEPDILRIQYDDQIVIIGIGYTEVAHLQYLSQFPLP